MFWRCSLTTLRTANSAASLCFWLPAMQNVRLTNRIPLLFPSSSPGELKFLYADSSLSKFFAWMVFAHNGFARMDLTTAKTNFSAQSLYESLGWVSGAISSMRIAKALVAQLLA